MTIEPASSRFLRFIGLLTAALIVLFPYLWIVLASIKPPDALPRPDVWLFEPVWNNWQEVLFDSDIPLNILNSLLVGIITVGISLLVGSPAAYVFSRFRTGGEPVRFAVLAAQMIPPSILIIPLFLIMYQGRLLDTVWAVAAAHLTFVLPVVTWFLIGFFDDIPRDLLDSAMVDGCNRLETFYRVALPYVRPGIAASAIFGFVLSWNEMFYALLLTGGDGKTLPAAIAGYWTFRGVELGPMSVAIMVSIIPVLIVSFFIQKYLIKGLGGGAVK